MSETAVDVAEAEVEEVTTPSGYGVFASDARAVFEACLASRSTSIAARTINLKRTTLTRQCMETSSGKQCWRSTVRFSSPSR